MRAVSRAIAFSVFVGVSRALVCQDVPCGSVVQVRLLDSVTADPRTVGRRVHAMVLQPVVSDGRIAIAPRSTLTGVVASAGIRSDAERRHFVTLRFDSVNTSAGAEPLSARVSAVINGRETVDSNGSIVGPPLPRLARSRLTWASLALGTAEPIAGAALFAAVRGEEMEHNRRIAIARGTDLTLVTTTATRLSVWPDYSLPDSTAIGAAARALAAKLPRRASTAGGRVSGDFINLVFVGSKADIERAFTGAQWAAPARLSAASTITTLVREAKAEGYERQPVSRQTIGGKPPDIVFQRVADSFAKRDHVRAWITGEVWDGKPVWVAAATRDVALQFMKAERGFPHRTDPPIDVERDKVVWDLVSALSVRGLSYFKVPQPTGAGSVVSDWRVAIVKVQD